MEEKEEERSYSFVSVVSSRFQVERCCFSRNGELLAACFGDYSVRVYRSSTSHAHRCRLALLCDFRKHESNVWCLEFSQDGSMLCSASSDKTVKVWSVESCSLKLSLAKHSSTVWCCSFAMSSSGEEYLASGSSDETVKIWNLEGELIHSLTGFSGAVESLCFSSDYRWMCTASEGGTVKLWTKLFHSDVEPRCVNLYSSYRWFRFCIFSNFVDESSHCCYLAANDSQNSILVWKVSLQDFDCDQHEGTSTLQHCTSEGKAPSMMLLGHTNIVWACSFVNLEGSTALNSNPGEEMDMVLVSCSGDKTVRFWSMKDGTCLQVIRQLGGGSQLLTCSFCPATCALAVGAYDGKLLVTTFEADKQRLAPAN